MRTSMENENKTEEQVEKAVQKAYDEHLDTDPNSPNIGRVTDKGYAKTLAEMEDDTRSTDPENPEFARYADIIIGEKIIKDMEESAARKVSQNEGGNYPDAQQDLIKKGLNPVDRFDSREKFGQIYDMQKAEEKRRKFREEEAKQKVEENQ